MSKAYGIIFEAAQNESFETDDLALSSDASDIEGEFDDTMDLVDDIGYTEEMVNVIGFQQNNQDLCLIEFENLVKYMNSNRIQDFEEAVRNIAECNNLPFEKMCVVFESDDTLRGALTEAKKIRKIIPEKLTKLKNTVDVLKLMKTKGIKVAKRKSKGRSSITISKRRRR